jgi:hypothetical protein
MSNPVCPRCKTATLTPLPDSASDVRFFACPQCRRQYAQAPGGALSFRWGHPISLALYPVLFDLDPGPRAPDVARDMLRRWTPEEARFALAEIQLELDSPTQDVRDILGSRAPEDRCREFLAALGAALRHHTG